MAGLVQALGAGLDILGCLVMLGRLSWVLRRVVLRGGGSAAEGRPAAGSVGSVGSVGSAGSVGSVGSAGSVGVDRIATRAAAARVGLDSTALLSARERELGRVVPHAEPRLRAIVDRYAAWVADEIGDP